MRTKYCGNVFFPLFLLKICGIFDQFTRNRFYPTRNQIKNVGKFTVKLDRKLTFCVFLFSCADSLLAVNRRHKVSTKLFWVELSTVGKCQFSYILLFTAGSLRVRIID